MSAISLFESGIVASPESCTPSQFRSIQPLSSHLSLSPSPSPSGLAHPAGSGMTSAEQLWPQQPDWEGRVAQLTPAAPEVGAAVQARWSIWRQERATQVSAVQLLLSSQL